MLKLFKVFSLVVVLLSSLLIAPSIDVHADADIVWIGDSRSVGLAQGVFGLSPTAGSGGNAETVAHKDGYHFIAKCSQGLNWGKGAIDKFDDFDGDTIVVWLGVNDLGNKESYRTWLTELSDSYTVYLVSVTQCYSPSSISNDTISDFNDMLKSIEGATYIDAYSLFEISTPSTDSMGVHYSASDYKIVFDLVKAKIEGSSVSNNTISSKYKLHFRGHRPIFMPYFDFLAFKRHYLIGGNI